MADTYVKSSGTRASTVTVEPAAGAVIVVSRDGNRAPHLDRCPADVPADLARDIGEGLISDGYATAGKPDPDRCPLCHQPWIYCFCGMPRPNGPR